MSAHPCRICHGPPPRLVGELHPYADYACDVYDCDLCGCRFAAHDDAVYERLHAASGSSYGAHRRVSAEVRSRARADDAGADAVGAYLRRERRYAFLLDAVEERAKTTRLLEVGSGRGYLAGYFLLRGYQVLGVERAESARDAAARDWGDHFVAPESPRIEAGAPYDAVYHAGTIGCVSDPVGLTRRLLELLRPGGLLAFNAPNADACCGRRQLWIDGTPPPDLVTLFRPAFWRRFDDLARVEVRVELADTSARLACACDRALGRRWKARDRGRLLELEEERVSPARGSFGRVTRWLDRLGLASALPPLPAEFGQLVRMTRR